MRAHDDLPSGKPPRRRFAGALAAFMEARNILWGELVGGLLVVGCSVALVVSLWQTFRDSPVFKFCTFTGAVAAVYGAGLYTLRRWKLESTSRGLLLIALLLTPITLLALTRPSVGASVPLDLPVQVASLLALGLLAWRAARVLAPGAAGHVAVALVLVSACQVPIARLGHRGPEETRWLVLGFLPVACYVACAGALFLQTRGRALDGHRAMSLFLFLAAGGFALLLTLGLLVFLGGDFPAALGRLALPLALAGLPLLALGALVHAGLEDERRWASQRLAGTAVALAGMVVMLLAVGLAWPRPLPVLLVCTLDFVALTLIAFRLNLPVAHALALPCLAGAYAVVYFLATGLRPVPDAELAERMLAAVTAPATGTALLLLFAVCAIVAEALARGGALTHARFYAVGSVGIALVSLALVTPGGLDAPGRALLTYGLAGAGILMLNLRWRRDEATCLGLGLLIAASLWGLWKLDGRVLPGWGTVLAGEALLLALVNLWLYPASRREVEPSHVPSETPLTWVGTVTACAAIVVAAWAGGQAWQRTGTPWASAHVATAAWLAILGTLRGVAEKQTNFARLGSWALLAVVVLAAGWVGEVQVVSEPALLIAGCLALASVLLAAGAIAFPRRRLRGAPQNWCDVLAPAWAEASVLAGLLALALLAPAPTARWNTATLLAVSIAAFLLAWPFRTAFLTWVGSTLLLVSLAHLLIWGIAPHEVPHPILAALLAHATLALAAGVLVGQRVRIGDAHARLLERLTFNPLCRSALVSSLAAMVPLLYGMTRSLLPLTAYALWLAGVYLLMAWLEESPGLFIEFQAALTLAVGLAVSVWLQGHDLELRAPRSLQIYGIALGLLSLMWVVIRARLQPGSTLARLLNPGGPVFDQLLLGALVLAQLGIALAGIAPGILREMAPREVGAELQRLGLAGTPLAATGLPAWLVLALLAVALAVEARVRLRAPVVVGLVLLATTVPVLIAGRFDPDRATASTLRWGLGACFLACSLPLWLREQLTPWARRMGLDVGPPFPLAPLARRLLVAATAIPVVAFAILAALSRLEGVSGPGPESSSIFSRMGRLYAGMVPLAMVCLGLVIHALRERLPGYAFAVGIGGNLMASLIVRSHHRADPLAVWWVPLVQANTIAFGGMALLWMATRRRLYRERGSGALLATQVGLGLVANTCLLATVLVPLVLTPEIRLDQAVQAGSFWGWLGLALAGAAALWFARATDPTRIVDYAAPLALGVGVLLAAVADGLPASPWLPYHVLTVAWALTAAGLLAVGWLRASPGTALQLVDAAPLDSPVPGQRFVAWVAAAGALVLGLALRAWVTDQVAPWWTASTVIFVGGVATALALWQRGEGWAFIAGLTVNLAVSLVFLHPERLAAPGDWPQKFLQLNLIAGAVVALAWLAVARRLYGAALPGPAVAPLLTLQVTLLLVGNAALVVVPGADLVAFPEAPPEHVARMGTVWGWLAQLASMPAAAWYARRLRRGEAVHLLPALALLLGLLAGGTAARWYQGAYVAYHVLTAAWALVGAALLAAGWLGQRRRGKTGYAALAAIFPARGVVPWVAVFGAGVLALGLRGLTHDPLSWWPAGTAVVAAALAGGLALWRRREGWAFTAGLCLNLAVSLVLWHRHQSAGVRDWWVPLLQANTLMAGIAAILWIAARRRLVGGQQGPPWATPFLSVQVLLGVAGNLVLLLHGLVWLLVSPWELPDSLRMTGEPLGWAALLAALVPLVWHLGPLASPARVPLRTGIGLALGVLTACAAAAWDEGGTWLAYQALVVAWGATAAAVLANGWPLLQRLAAPAEATEDEHPGAGVIVACVAAVGALVLALALRAVAVDPGRPWWSSGLVLFLSVLAALLAYRRRQEAWAFVAALGVHLAVSLVVATKYEGQSLDLWWVVLVQANMIAGGLAALLWPLGSRMLHGPAWAGPRSAPLLGIELAALLAGNVALLIGPLTLLIANPGTVAKQVEQAGHLAGWLSLLLTFAAACWYAGRMPGLASVNVLCGLGLALGVLTACTAAQFQRDGWLAYHVLTTGWALLAALILTIAWQRTADAAGMRGGLLVTGWVAALGVLVLTLALRGVTDDPGRPWWPAGTVLAVSLLLGGLALYSCREMWAFACALGVYLAVSLVVAHFNAGRPLSAWWFGLLQVNVVGGAAVACAWLFSARHIYGTSHPPLSEAPLLLTAVGAVLAGTGALLLGPAAYLIAHPAPLDTLVRQAGSPWGWLAVLAGGGVAVRYFRLYRRRPAAAGVAAGGVVLGILAACTAAHADSGQWLAYHVLTLAWAVTGFVVLAREWSRPVAILDSPTPPPAPPYPWRVDLSIGAVGVLVVGLALRGMLGDPLTPRWSIGAVLAVAFQGAVLAVWRCSETWAFMATLSLDLAVSLFVWDSQGASEAWWVQLLQANILSGCVAALLWAVTNRRAYLEQPAGVAAAPLLSAQVFVSLAGTAVLLFNPAFVALVMQPGNVPPGVVAADGIAGWLTLLLTAVVAVVQLRLTRMQGGVQVLGSLGVAAGVLAACTAAHWDQKESWLAYHVLMAAWATFAALMLLGGWLDARWRLLARLEDRDARAVVLSESLVREWVVLVGLPVLALVLRGALDDPTGPWWSAGVLLGMSLLTGLLAAWQRRERWAFTAGLGVNLAVSLVLWRNHLREPLTDWWLPLVRGNVLACSGVAFAWLALSRRMYGPGTLRLGAAPLLGLQVLLGLLGNLVLLATPAWLLVRQPEPLDPLVLQAGDAVGWLSLVLAALAAAWHLGRTRAPGSIHVLVALALGLGVMAACVAARLHPGDWVPYHVLMAAWAVLGWAVVAAGWAAERRGTPGTGVARGWAVRVGLLVLALALRGVLVDPAGAWWSAGGVLAVSVLAALMAAWLRREAPAFAAALGVSLAVSLVLWRSHDGQPVGGWWLPLAQANILAASGAALAWLLLARYVYDEVAVQKGNAPLLAVQAFFGAATTAIVLAYLAAVLVGQPGSLAAPIAEAGGPIGWLALGLAVLPAAWHLARSARAALPHLFAGAGLGAGVMAACTSAAHTPDAWLGYHVLNTSWAALGLAVVAGTGMAFRRPAFRDEPPVTPSPREDGVLFTRGQAWVLAIGALVLALALQIAFLDPAGPWWTAGAILSVSVMSAALALGRREEVWAFLAALGVNLAVSLVIRHPHRTESLGEWWGLLVHVNIVVSSVVALLWLLARRRIDPLTAAGGLGPLLTLQILLGALGNTLLLVGPAVLLVLYPRELRPGVHQAAGVWGWPALAVALLPTFALPGLTRSRAGLHMLCGLALCVSVLAACTVGVHTGNSWHAYHTLTAGVAVAGCLALASGLRLERGESGTELPVSPAALLRAWAVAFGLFLLVLACRGVAVDLGGTWWSAAAVLVVAGMAAGLAVAQRSEDWAFAAGLAVNLAVSFFLWGWHRDEALSAWALPLLQLNLMATALTALVWSMLARHTRPAAVPGPPATSLLTVQVSLALVGNILVLAGAGLLLFGEPDRLAPTVLQTGGAWGWLALLLTLAVAFHHLGGARTFGPVPVTGLLGLLGGVLGACSVADRFRDGWIAYHFLTVAWAVAGPALLAAAAWSARRHRAPADEVRPSFHAGPVVEWATAFGVLTLVLALRGAASDPGSAWWSAGAVLAAGALFAALAVRQRQEAWAFRAGLCGNLAVTLLVHAHRAQLPGDWIVLLVQANLVAAAVAALAWIAAQRRLRAAVGPPTSPLLTLQVALLLIGNVALLVLPAVMLLVQPGDLPRSVEQAGSVGGWLSLLLALTATAWYAGRTRLRDALHLLCGLGLLLGILAACTAAQWDRHGQWLAYHVLMMAWSLVGLLTLGFGWARTRRLVETTSAAVVQGWVTAMALLMAALALRGAWVDPTGPWASAGVLTAVAVLSGALAFWSIHQGYVRFSGLMLVAAGVALGSGWGWRQPLDLLHVGTLSLALAAGVWSALESLLRSRVTLRDKAPPFAHVATLMPLAVLLGLVAVRVAAWSASAPPLLASPLAWPLLLAVLIALVVSLWDVDARFSLAGLQAVGVAALALALAELPPRWHYLTAPGLAAFVTLTTLCWRHAERLHWLGAGFGLPPRQGGWPADWFPPTQAVLAGGAVVLSLWVCLTRTASLERFAGPVAVALLVPTALAFASTQTGTRRASTQFATLMLGALALVEAAWAPLNVSVPSPWLQRTGMLLTVSALLTIAYGVALPQLLPSGSDWREGSLRASALLAVSALGLVVLVLLQEVALYRRVHPLMTVPALLAVVFALALLIVAGVCFAVLPGLDPFALPERRRTGYVYLGEVLLVVLFVHLRLTTPEWFRGNVGRHWTFVVMAIAFFGAGVSEVLGRLGVRVLAEPLRRTGAFLPMIPVLAFWVRPVDDYATLWFVVGLFYAMLSVLDRSMAFGLLAALGFNIGLWVVLHEQQVAFIRYPQLWLVPFALSVLVATHLNRDRLGRSQTATLRYLALTVLYLSSTAETFVSGLGRDASRPLILIGLSLAGVFAGMLLRIRAFLFLGSGFIGLGIFALVWHAAESKAWLWYVAGIALGLLIIVLFAVFEKRRNDVLRLLEKLRDWEY